MHMQAERADQCCFGRGWKNSSAWRQYGAGDSCDGFEAGVMSCARSIWMDGAVIQEEGLQWSRYEWNGEGW